MSSETGESTNIPSAESKEVISKPNIIVDFFFSGHSKSIDFEGLGEALEKADVYIPEGPMPAELVEVYRKVANGELTPEQALEHQTPESHAFYHARRAELQKLYNTKKPIVYLDIPKESPQLEHLTQLRNEARKWRNSFAEATNVIASEVTALAKVSQLREELMVNNLSPFIHELVEASADLKTKPTLQVLFSIGTAHKPLINKFQDQGISVVEHVSKPPIQELSYLIQSMQNYEKTGQIDEILLAKTLMERTINTFFKKHFKEVIPYPDKLTALLRKIIEQFTLEEIKAIFDHSFSNPAIILTRLETQFLLKNITIPHDEAALDAFLAQETTN